MPNVKLQHAIAGTAIAVGLGLMSARPAQATLVWNNQGYALAAYDTTTNSVQKYVAVSKSIDLATRTIRYEVVFNKAGESWTAPYLHVYLAKGLEESSILIKRSGQGDLSKNIFNEGKEPGNTFWESSSGSGAYDSDFESRLIETAKGYGGYTAEDINELYYWKNNGLLGPHVYSHEWSGAAIRTWTITATYKQGVDPYTLPFIAIMHSGLGNSPVAYIEGPHNSDKHNFPDMKEVAWGIDPLREDLITQYVSPSLSEDKKITLDNPLHLSDADKAKVLEATKEAVRQGIAASSRKLNADAILNDPDFTIAVFDDGDIRIAYPDWSTTTNSVDWLRVEDLTKTAEKTKAPVPDPVFTSSAAVTGTAAPHAWLSLSLPDGTVLTGQADGEGNFSIALGDKKLAEGDTLELRAAENGKDPSDAVSVKVKPSLADLTEVAKPAEKVYVDDASHLSATENEQVKANVLKANQSLPAGSVVKVAGDGSVEIVYSDGSKDTIAAADTVIQKQNSASATVVAPKFGDTSVSGKGVSGALVELFDAEGKKLGESRVASDGSWKIENLSRSLKPAELLSLKQTESNKLPKSINTVVELLPPLEPVAVDDMTCLTEIEIGQVLDKIKAANTGVDESKLQVNDDGSVSVNFAEGVEPQTIPADQTVYQKPASKTPELDTPIDGDDLSITGRGVPGASIVVDFGNGVKKKTTVDASGHWKLDDVAGDLVPGNRVTVTQTEEGKKPTTAEPYQIKAVTPTDIVEKTDGVDLGEDQQNQIKENIKATNPDLPGGTNIEVDPSTGEATVHYPNGAVETISAEDTVVSRSQMAAPTIAEVTGSATKLSGTGSRDATVTIQIPGREPVTATVNSDGLWETATIDPIAPGTQLSVTQDDATHTPSSPVVTTVGLAAGVPVGVQNTAELTPAEIVKVKDEVARMNPGMTAAQKAALQVSTTGEVTLNGLVLPAEKTVYQLPASTAAEINPVQVGDSTVSGHGVPGSKVQVQLPNGNWTDPVGVDSKGKWSVTLPGGTSLKAHDKLVAKQYSDSTTPTTSETFVAASPTATRVSVDNKDQLTPAEIDEVKDAVAKANGVDESAVSVAADGTATITYGDGKQDLIPGEKLVQQKGPSAVPTVNPVDGNDNALSGTGTPSSEGAKTTIDVFKADGTKKIGTGEVGSDGKWTVNLDQNVELIPGEKLTITQREHGMAPASTEVEVQPTLPENPLVVDDVTKLTEKEKDQLRSNFEAANPDIATDKIEIDDQGNITVHINPAAGEAEGHDIVIPAEKLVKQRETSAPAVVYPVKSNDRSISGEGVPGARIRVVLADGTELPATVETPAEGEPATWKVELSEGAELHAGDIIRVYQTELEKLERLANVEVDKTFAENLELQLPADKVSVKDPDKLSDEDLAKILDNLKKTNPGIPDGTKLVVDGDKIKIVYPDGSSDEFATLDLVKKQIDPTAAGAGKASRYGLPKTSDPASSIPAAATITGILGTLAAALGIKKRR